MSDDVISPGSIVFDMETQDPDDYLTLLMLLGHPRVRLVAVTIMPGSPTQVGLIRRTLEAFGHAHVPVGAFDIDHKKPCMSPWHERAYGEVTPSRDAEPAGELLARVCDEATTLLTGAPIKNLGLAMDHEAFHVGRWVAQGGFAGEGVVPRERQLPKFKGRTTCPTYNLNGAPHVALRALEDERFGERMFVSKNVCHNVVYDARFHRMVQSAKRGSKSLEWIYEGMEGYLSKKSGAGRLMSLSQSAPLPEEVRLMGLGGKSVGVMSGIDARACAEERGFELARRQGVHEPPLFQLVDPNTSMAHGKKLHDPLAACCAIEPSIGTWEEVEIYRERGEWGARRSPGSSTRIIVDHDDEAFRRVFLERA